MQRRLRIAAKELRLVRVQSLKSFARVVSRTAGLLGKRFPSGASYQRGLRHTWSKRVKVRPLPPLTRREESGELAMIKSRRREPGRPLRRYLRLREKASDAKTLKRAIHTRRGTISHDKLIARLKQRKLL